MRRFKCPHGRGKEIAGLELDVWGDSLVDPTPRSEAESCIRNEGNYRTRLLRLDVIRLGIGLYALDLSGRPVKVRPAVAACL